MSVGTESGSAPSQRDALLEHLSTALEAARLGTFDVDLETGCTRASTRAREIFGVASHAEERISEAILYARVHPDDRGPFRDAFRAASQRPDGAYAAEFRVVHDDGTTRWVTASARVFLDGSPKPRAVRVAGMVSDVTGQQEALYAQVAEHRRTAQALREIEETTALAVEAAHIGVYEWSPATDRAVWSPIMHRLHGHAPGEEITLAKAIECIHRDDVERVKHSLVEVMDPAGDGRFDIEYRTVVGGEVHWIHSVGRVRFEDLEAGRTATRLAGIVIDVTARKNLEAALRDASRRKDEFLAMLGHELRNPLAPLRMASGLMPREDLDPGQVRALHAMIARQVAHMTRLVDDLLDTARIGRGKLSLSRAPVELNTLLEAALDGARAYTEPLGQRVELQLPRERLWIDADAVRITQVVGNLLHNAAKFSDEGAVIRVSLARADGHAAIRVRDSGKGIPAELLPHVFELFTQGEASAERQKGGLGLGLALVRDLVRLHDGSVSAASEGMGKGSEFTVRLPLAAAGAARAAEPAHERSARSRRVLVVDDNRDAAAAIKLLLELSGHEVEVAATGEEAIDMAHRWSPDAVLVDIGLPDIDGYEVARRIRALGPQLTLAALTGYGGADSLRRSMQAGFDRHFVKPVVPEDVLRLLNDLPAAEAQAPRA